MNLTYDTSLEEAPMPEHPEAAGNDPAEDAEALGAMVMSDLRKVVSEVYKPSP